MLGLAVALGIALTAGLEFLVDGVAESVLLLNKAIVII